MLSGTKRPQDMLHVGDYVTALGDMARHYLALIGSMLNRATAIVLTAGVVVAVAFTLVAILSSQVQAAIASLVGLLGIAGLTGTTVLAAAKKALTEAGDHFWGAELAATIAVAIDKVPQQMPNSAVQQLRDANRPTRPPVSEASIKK